MVKGCEKRAIRLQSAESRVFEEVLFILRDTASSAKERDIVKEAEEILRENTARRAEPRRRGGGIFPFFLGMLTASVLLLPAALLL